MSKIKEIEYTLCKENIHFLTIVPISINPHLLVPDFSELSLENQKIETVQTDGKVHTKLARETAQEMVKIMMENQGWAELFPYEECEQLADLFGFPFSW